MDLFTLRQRIWKIMLTGLCVAILAYLIFPLLVIIPLSFSADRFFTFTPGMLALDPSAYSTRWYQELFTNPQWASSLRNSLLIAIVAALLSATLGTMAALALWRARLPCQSMIAALLVAPMIVPIIVTAAGIYLFFNRVSLVQTYLGVILAHVVLSAPYVVLTIGATLTGFDRNLARAAATLGAPPLVSFRRVMLPILWPGVASATAYAFISSFEEIVVVLFLVTGDMRTLPRQMWSGANDQLSPTIFAAAVLMVVGSVLILAMLSWMKHRTGRID